METKETTQGNMLAALSSFLSPDIIDLFLQGHLAKIENQQKQIELIQPNYEAAKAMYEEAKSLFEAEVNKLEELTNTLNKLNELKSIDVNLLAKFPSVNFNEPKVKDKFQGRTSTYIQWIPLQKKALNKVDSFMLASDLFDLVMQENPEVEKELRKEGTDRYNTAKSNNIRRWNERARNAGPTDQVILFKNKIGLRRFLDSFGNPKEKYLAAFNI